MFEDDKGNLTLAQKPNLPIVIWAVARLLQFVFTNGTFATLLETISFGALFTWAWLELFKGDTPFRRIVGFVVITATIYSKIQ